MPFGIVSGVSRMMGVLDGVVSGVRLGMGVLDFGGDRRRGRGSLVGEFAASHCNQ